MPTLNIFKMKDCSCLPFSVWKSFNWSRFYADLEETILSYADKITKRSVQQSIKGGKV